MVDGMSGLFLLLLPLGARQSSGPALRWVARGQSLSLPSLCLPRWKAEVLAPLPPPPGAAVNAEGCGKLGYVLSQMY